MIRTSRIAITGTLMVALVIALSWAVATRGSRRVSMTREVAREMRQVSWPARTEVVNTTIVVVVAVFFFSFYLFAADLVFTYLIRGLEWVAGKIF